MLPFEVGRIFRVAVSNGQFFHVIAFERGPEFLWRKIDAALTSTVLARSRINFFARRESLPLPLIHQ